VSVDGRLNEETATREAYRFADLSACNVRDACSQAAQAMTIAQAAARLRSSHCASIANPRQNGQIGRSAILFRRVKLPHRDDLEAKRLLTYRTGLFNSILCLCGFGK
jgi:hypothetical protein